MPGMTTKLITPFLAAALAAGAVLAGCGSSGSGSSGGGSSSGSGGSPGALSADARSASTGDIPDNQNFLTFKDATEGFSIRYPEGWAQNRAGNGITFQDKNNLVRVAVAKGPAPTVASVKAELAKLKSKSPTLQAQAPRKMTIKGQPVIKVVYTTESTPNQVTGKRVTLMVDRYEYAKGGKVAVLDLGTPKGVDNVDAYRLMSESFTWL
jgi:hypothetical protein